MTHETAVWWQNADWWLAALTFILAFWTWRLVVQTRRLVDEAKSTSERQAAEVQQSLEVSRQASLAAKTSADAFQVAQRAWVSFDSILPPVENTGTIGGRPDHWLEFQLSWRNAGSTPAVNCRLFAMGHSIVATDDVPAFPIPGAAEGPTATLLPNVSMTGAPVVLRMEVVEKLKAREVRFFLHARAAYEDVFSPGVVRHTELCFEATVQGYMGNVPRFAYGFVGQQNTSS